MFFAVSMAATRLPPWARSLYYDIFLVYESSKRLMINDMKLPEPVAHFTSGFLGDLASSFIYVPSEVLKPGCNYRDDTTIPISILGTTIKA